MGTIYSLGRFESFHLASKPIGNIKQLLGHGSKMLLKFHHQYLGYF